MVQYSKHAIKRQQQRSISEDAVEIAIEWGESVRMHGQARLFYLGKRAVQRAWKRGLDFTEYLNTAVVISDDGIVRTAYKTTNPRLRT